jgi:hypothetical protein
MISILKVQTPETDLIEKIKAAIKKACGGKGQADVSQEAQEASKTLTAHYAASNSFPSRAETAPKFGVVGGRPLWCPKRTQVGHRTMSEMCQ